MRAEKLTGAALIASPLLLQLVFAILAARFDYPDVLRLSGAEILNRFHEGGLPLLATWYAFALAGLPLVAAIPALPRVWKIEAPVVTALGVAGGLLQVLALSRWTFAVPFLARAHADGDAGAAAAFTALHTFVGLGLGEHLGVLLVALWTGGLSSALPGLLRPLGLVSSALLLSGLFETLATAAALDPGPLQALPVAGYFAWSVWLVALGLRTFAGAPPSDRAQSAT